MRLDNACNCETNGLRRNARANAIVRAFARDIQYAPFDRSMRMPTLDEFGAALHPIEKIAALGDMICTISPAI